MLPLAFDFFLGFQQFGTAGADRRAGGGRDVDASSSSARSTSTSSLTIKFIVAFGLCFQLPVLLTLMGRPGSSRPRGSAGMRKYALVGILIARRDRDARPDVMSQVILFAVVYRSTRSRSCWCAWSSGKREARAAGRGPLGRGQTVTAEEQP